MCNCLCQGKCELRFTYGWEATQCFLSSGYNGLVPATPQQDFRSGVDQTARIRSGNKVSDQTTPLRAAHQTRKRPCPVSPCRSNHARFLCTAARLAPVSASAIGAVRSGWLRSASIRRGGAPGQALCPPLRPVLPMLRVIEMPHRPDNRLLNRPQPAPDLAHRVTPAAHPPLPHPLSAARRRPRPVRPQQLNARRPPRLPTCRPRLRSR